MKLVDDSFKKEIPTHFEVNLTSEECGTLLGTFLGLAELKDAPDFMREAAAAMTVPPTRIERSFAVLKWTRSECQAVLHTLMNYINAGSDHVQKYTEEESYRSIRSQLEELKSLHTLCEDILHQVERQGFEAEPI